MRNPIPKSRPFDAEEPLACASYRLRRAARKAAILYDRALKPVGLRNTQFSVLGALNFLGDISIGDLAEELATDATTLNRTLGTLARDRLVTSVPGPDGRVRIVRLTDHGRTILETAMPLWRAAQEQVLKETGPDRWAEARLILQKIETACDR